MRIKPLTAVFLISLLLHLIPKVHAAPEVQSAGRGLFIDPAIPVNPDGFTEPSIGQKRYVEVDFALLANTGVGDRIRLNLFEGVDFTAVIHNAAVTPRGAATWVGVLEGIDYSQVALVAFDGQVAGNIHLPAAAYQVSYAGEGIHALLAVEETVFPPEAEPIPVESVEMRGEYLPESPAADDGSLIDVLVVYTPAARSAAGGTTAIQNQIELAVLESNQSFINSGINSRLNLVYSAEVPYSESGSMDTDLSRLRDPDDGFMDTVHVWRDQYKADVVSLLEESNQYCGISYLMTTVSATFAPNAFSIAARHCAVGNYSFAHELGHNMGARHDWYVDDAQNSPFQYNKGYVNVPGQWRTIMAYNNECQDRGGSCTRLQYWSNPDVQYGGEAMGVPAGTSVSCKKNDLNHPRCDADNRQTLNNTAYTVANFRVSEGAGTNKPPTISVIPKEISKSIYKGTALELTLKIKNTGMQDLFWEILDNPPDQIPVLDEQSLVVPQDLVEPLEGDGRGDAGAAHPYYASQTESLDTASQLDHPPSVLYDNGPIVNSPGSGAGGADESVLNTSLGMNTMGYTHQVDINNRIADDFMVADEDGWCVKSITTYAYQTGSSTDSTLTGLNFRIWDGEPGKTGSKVVFGDKKSNRLVSSVWANVYRVAETTSGDTERPVMANSAAAGVYLPAGTYWLDWQMSGSLPSGPWAPPLAVKNQAATGNGLQYTGNWKPAVDSGSETRQGFPFILEGSAGNDDCEPSSGPWANVTPSSGKTKTDKTSKVKIILDAKHLEQGSYYDEFYITCNDPDQEMVIVPIDLEVVPPERFLPLIILDQ